MPFVFCIRLCGSSAQGLPHAARILAEAAAIYDGRNAAESCSYGPEARGRAARAEILVSDDAIESPRVETVDLLVALTQEAYDRYVGDCRPDGVVLIDAEIETGAELGSRALRSADFSRIARDACGDPSMMNIAALGFFAGVCGSIGEDSIRKAILSRSPKTSEESYLSAFEAGLLAARASDNEEGTL